MAKSPSKLNESVFVELKERIAELELYIEDIGWNRIGGEGNEEEFSRDALSRIAHLSRLMYLKNPLVNRGVSVKRNYVWGQGVSIKANDPEVDKVIQMFMNDRQNLVEFTGHSAQIQKETDLMCDGNVFLVLFSTKEGRVRLRSIPFSQMKEIKSNPEDSKDVWYFKRDWLDKNGSAKTAYYPSWLYLPADKPTTLDDKEVKWDAPVMHVKIGGFSDWKFGIGEVYASIDWAKAYKEFLEDWATITRAYAKFAWKASTRGGKAGVAAIKTKFDAGTEYGDSKTPAVGSMAITSEGADLNPIRTAGATTTPEDGRRIMLMVTAALGLPETFFGDVSVGTLATATSLDRPTELLMMDRQALWSQVFTDVLNYVLLKAIQANKLPGKGNIIEEENTLPQIEWIDSDFDDQVQIRFPDIIEGDKAANVEAVVKAVSTGLLDPETMTRLLLTALGETDVEQTVEDLYDEEEPTAVEAWQKIQAFIEKYTKMKV